MVLLKNYEICIIVLMSFLAEIIHYVLVISLKVFTQK